MKNLIAPLIALFLLQNTANAQNAKSAEPAKKANHYLVDRDSAFTDPRLAIKKLIGGNKRFVENKSIRPRQDVETIKKLGFGQKPFATIVSCSDSRVPNEIIFDQGLGDLFIVRTAGQVF